MGMGRGRRNEDGDAGGDVCNVDIWHCTTDIAGHCSDQGFGIPAPFTCLLLWATHLLSSMNPRVPV